MLWPGPKSTAISPGTPRKAFMTRRCSRSPTAQLLEQLADRLRAAFGRRVHQLDQAAAQALGQALDLTEHRLQELALVRSLHGTLSRVEATEQVTQQRQDLFPAAGGGPLA